MSQPLVTFQICKASEPVRMAVTSPVVSDIFDGAKRGSESTLSLKPLDRKTKTRLAYCHHACSPLATAVAFFPNRSPADVTQSSMSEYEEDGRLRHLSGGRDRDLKDSFRANLRPSSHVFCTQTLLYNRLRFCHT